MIERAKQALIRAAFTQAATPIDASYDIDVLVRAVMTEMHNPTIGMLTAGREEAEEYGTRAVWQAMIDAALEGQ